MYPFFQIRCIESAISRTQSAYYNQTDSVNSITAVVSDSDKGPFAFDKLPSKHQLTKMTKITRIRKQILRSPWFTDRLQLEQPPLTSVTRTGGLENPGNVCFINSCLQSLIHCEPFARAILHLDHQHKSNKGFCALCEVKRVCKDLLMKKKEVSGVHELSSKCRQLNPNFEPGVQQDAHEFLTSLLTKLEIEDQLGCGAIFDGVYDSENGKKKSFIDQLFRFRIKQTVTCSKCGGQSETEEILRSLPLRPTKEREENIKTVNEGLRFFFGSEVLDGENLYACASCNKLVKATKRVSLMEGPNVFVISVERFSVTFDEKRKLPNVKKATHFIKYTERLDVTPYMHEMTVEEELKLGGHQYRLSSFIYHIGGSIHEGHYAANVFLPSRCSASQVGSWWEKNDSHVDQVGFEKDKGVFLLFYTREDLQPHFLTGPRKKKVSKKIGAGHDELPIHSSHCRIENDLANDARKRSEKRRVFLLPKLNMKRTPLLHSSAEEIAQKSSQILEKTSLPDDDLSIGSSDKFVIEEVYQSEPESEQKGSQSLDKPSIPDDVLSIGSDDELVIEEIYQSEPET